MVEKKELGLAAAIGLGIILFALSKRKEEAPEEKPPEVTPAPPAPSPPEYVIPYPPKHSLYASVTAKPQTFQEKYLTQITPPLKQIGEIVITTINGYLYTCIRCGYIWQSPTYTRTVKCPKCGSTEVTIQYMTANSKFQLVKLADGTFRAKLIG